MDIKGVKAALLFVSVSLCFAVALQVDSPANLRATVLTSLYFL